MTAAEYQELAARFKAQAATAGISPKRATLLTNISRTYTALASQFTMLIDDMKADRREKGRERIGAACQLLWMKPIQPRASSFQPQDVLAFRHHVGTTKNVDGNPARVPPLRR